MIRVTIDLVRFGDEAQVKTLQTLIISNIGGTKDRGSYECILKDHRQDGECIGLAYIQNWPRLRKDAAALVQEALYRMGYGRELKNAVS